jgi:hypothetical protein
MTEPIVHREPCRWDPKYDRVIYLDKDGTPLCTVTFEPHEQTEPDGHVFVLLVSP